MSTWKLRLRKESVDLKNRITRLEDFLYSDELNSLPIEDQYLLENQLKAMKDLYSILEQRCFIHDIKINENTFNYGRALELLEEGRRVSSTRWGTDGKVLVSLRRVEIPDTEEVVLSMFIIDTTRKKVTPFTPSLENQFEDEWYEVTAYDFNRE